VDFVHYWFLNRNHTIKPAEWPAEYRWIVDALLADPERWDRTYREKARGNILYLRNSPRFFLIQRREFVAVATGISGWKDEIAPALREITGV
jgi:hypothetical protein